MAELAYYGDDVTGSVDVLLQFARRGLSGRLFIGVPDRADLLQAARSVDVVGIAGIARSLATADLDAEVRPALEALRDTRAGIVQYKACSTVDSSPQIGSLGRVLEIAREVFGQAPTPVLFAQPDFGRYTAFGHHFAAEGGTVHRLDRQPTMSTHPSTPIDESDIALLLGRQTPLPIESVPFTDYASSAVLASSIDGSDAAAVILDALDDSHLALVGDALVSSRTENPRFVLGSGGLSRAVTLALPAAERGGGSAAASDGPVLVVSGSRSPASSRQAHAAREAGWFVAPLSFDGTDAAVQGALARGRSVVLTADDADVPAGVEPLPAIARASALAVSTALRAGLTRRVIVCGGDTSSRVVRLLGIHSLSIASHLGGNVVLLRAGADDPAIDGVDLLLKGGQVGDDSLFERVRLA